jgi:hypothetical protein
MSQLFRSKLTFFVLWFKDKLHLLSPFIVLESVGELLAFFDEGLSPIVGQLIEHRSQRKDVDL